MANIQGSNPIESVVDPSSSIIVMSKKVCHMLGSIYDTLVIIDLQSANGGINHSLGLACNIPCEISRIMLYVQIHIIHNTAYDVLLGCPFNVVTKSNMKNWSDESQTITIFNMNSTKVSTVPTFLRSMNHPRFAHENFHD
jgi:hypothetical protein